MELPMKCQALEEAVLPQEASWSPIHSDISHQESTNLKLSIPGDISNLSC
jgi:hypothetical protein